MGHYDTCRPENCAGCGQAKGVVWGCGRRYCSTYHIFLKQNNPEKYERLMAELQAEREAAEERRVTQRQVARRTREIASEARRVAEAE